MAHQPTPNTNTVLDHTTEKVILSGTRFISSMYGEDQGITAASVPLFYIDPIITGPFVLGEAVAPPLLTCEAQSFSSSPRATITYQWKRDAVNITDATDETYVTVTADIGTTVTCEATITNPSGSDTGLSNGIGVTALIPSRIGEMDVMTLTGMDDPVRATVSTAEICIIVGLEHYMKIDINEADLYIPLGMPNDVKIDINEESLNVFTGMAGKDKIDVDEGDAYVISCVGSLEKVDVDEADAYAMWVPEVLTPLVVLNGDAENSVMTDWTMDTGNVQSVTSATGASSTYRGGLRFFKADNLGLGIDSQMSQEITIPAGDLTDIDTGRCYAVARCLHDSEEGYDHIEITLEAINATPAVIGTATHVLASNPDGLPWQVDSTLDNPLSIPTLTRTIKITVLFKANDVSGGPDNNGYLDDIVIELLKV